MSIEGRIAIDVNFADSSDATGVQSLKKISLVDTTSYSTGKVAAFSGTCGTAQLALMSGGDTGYRDAAGSTVAFSTIVAVAMQAAHGRVRFYNGLTDYFIPANRAAVVPPISSVPTGFTVETTAGTATYTLVLYGT
jgi:hypothetical protein